MTLNMYFTCIVGHISIDNIFIIEFLLCRSMSMAYVIIVFLQYDI